VRHEDDLVVLGVEADVVAAHVVVDDEIHVLVRQHRAFPREAVLPALGAEGDEHLPFASGRTECARDVGRRHQSDRPGV
jgi:hypothetical protein